MHPRTRELLEHLDRQRAVIRAAFDAVPPELRDTVPASGQWSVANIVEHVSFVDRGVSKIVSAAIARGISAETETTPILPTIDDSKVVNREMRVMAPETAHPRGLAAAEAWAALEQGGDALRHAVTQADGLALGEVSFPHPIFGPLSLYYWIVFAGSHEARHAAQIREVAADLSGR